jgi:hypothetical protein
MKNTLVAVDLAKSVFQIALFRAAGEGKPPASSMPRILLKFKAAVALANKLVRVAWAVSRRDRDFEPVLKRAA